MHVVLTFTLYFPEKLVMKDDQEWCMDVFDHFVLAGQSATVGEAVVRRYRPVSADNDHIVLHIFSSDRDDCKVSAYFFQRFLVCLFVCNRGDTQVSRRAPDK